MTIKDIGPEPQSFNLEKATLDNTNYRAVAWSGKYSSADTHVDPRRGGHRT